MEKLRLEAAAIPTVTAPSFDTSVRLKLPVFQDGEDISSFITRFERIASLLNLARDSYALRLGTVLGGRALDIYASLTPDTTNDYDALKRALLQGYNKTPDSYRKEFRSLRVGSNETFSQFACQLGRSLDNWIEAMAVPKTYDDLRTFIIRDQIVSSVHPDLRTFLKENDPPTLPDIIRLCDNWTNARGSANRNVGRASRPNDTTSPAPLATGFPLRSTDEAPSGSRAFPNSGSPRTSLPKSDIKCYHCGANGHVKSTCPQMASSSVRPDHVNVCTSSPSVSDYRCSGRLNGSRVCNIVRDTGCTCVIVSADLLPALKTKTRRLVPLADYLGRVDHFPVVRCFLKCPYFTGWTNVLRAPLPSSSIIIGNVPGAADPFLTKTDPTKRDEAEDSLRRGRPSVSVTPPARPNAPCSRGKVAKSFSGEERKDSPKTTLPDSRDSRLTNYTPTPRRDNPRRLPSLFGCPSSVRRECPSGSGQSSQRNPFGSNSPLVLPSRYVLQSAHLASPNAHVRSGCTSVSTLSRHSSALGRSNPVASKQIDLGASLEAKVYKFGRARQKARSGCDRHGDS